MFGLKRRDNVFAGQLDFVAGLDPDQLTDHSPPVESLPGQQQPLYPFDHVGRQIDHGGLHLHHPPAGDEHGNRREVVEMGVCDEPVAGSQKGPGTSSQVETQLELGDARYDWTAARE